MNQLYPVLNVSGGEVLPTANGSFTTAPMASNPAQNCQVYAEFFSDAAGTIPVTPTAGTVSVYGSPMGNNYLAPSNAATITAANAATPTSTYTPPAFVGRMVMGKITFAGVTGAAYARVTFWRYD